MGSFYDKRLAVELAKLHGPVVGVILPSDVLSYRKTWDAYVTGVAKAALECSQIKGLDPTLASVHASESDSIMFLWNQDKNLTDAEILLSANSILVHEQDTVLQAGKIALGIHRDCPKITIPSIPTIAIQQQVIGNIQGQGILASGILQLIGLGANGALQTIGAFVPGTGPDPTGPLGDFIKQLKTVLVFAGGIAILAIIGPAVAPLIGGYIARGNK